jgi:methylmalonyl-CoA mutase, N-terminal domain
VVPRKLQDEKAEWSQGPLKAALAHFPERDAPYRTASGLAIDRLYLPDLEPIEHYHDRLGFPGAFPFTRGAHPTMYRSRLWTMREYAGYSTAEETNRRNRYLLSQGSTGLSIAFDLPTQIGLDSDHPLCVGEVGKVGVTVNTLADMDALFEGIPLDQVSTSMTINGPAAILLAMYVALAEKRGIDPATLRGTIQNDILKEYLARGTYIFPPGPSLRLIENTFEFCSRNIPHWNTISISGYHIREAGATAVQELAFTLADAICYIETALKAGLHIDDFAARLAFFFAAHSDFFEEIAKFRAARRLYARIMKERFQARKPESMMLRFHTQTSGATLTAQQADNNVVRVTLQALAAVLGGTQSLHTNSKDEALSLPTEDSVRLALRTQQVIAHEIGVVDTVDPLGGSFYVEQLTDAIEAEAEKLINSIDALGGMVAAIEGGFARALIDEAAFQWSDSVEKKERIVVGVNEFTEPEAPHMHLFEVGEEVRLCAINRLKQVRAERDGRAVADSLANLRESALDPTVNLMPPLLAAVRAYSTIGEICGILRDVFGEYRA